MRINLRRFGFSSLLALYTVALWSIGPKDGFQIEPALSNTANGVRAELDPKDLPSQINQLGKFLALETWTARGILYQTMSK